MVSAGIASVELFTYPWDILDCGIPRFVDECRELGVDRLHVTTLYHSGKFLLPRNQTSRVYFPEPGCLYIPLPENSFRGAITAQPAGWLLRRGWRTCAALRAAQDFPWPPGRCSITTRRSADVIPSSRPRIFLAIVIR